MGATTVAAALLLPLWQVAPAAAGTPGRWSNLSGLTGTTTRPSIVNFAEPTVARFGGDLTVLWPQEPDVQNSVYRSSTVSPGGAVRAAAHDALSGFSSLVAGPRLFSLADGTPALAFSGLVQDPGPWSGWNSGRGLLATSADGGATFVPQSGALTADSAAYAGYGFDAVGTPTGPLAVTTGAGSGGLSHRRGILAGGESNALTGVTDPTLGIPGGGCCAYDAAVAVDSVNGQGWAAFYSNAGGSAASGVFYGPLTDAAKATAKQAPGSFSRSGTPGSLAPDQRLPLVTRPGGGVFLAYELGYPTATAIRVLEVASGRSFDVKAPGAEAIGLAAAGDGRLWLTWRNDDVAYAARTDTGATRIGAVARIGAPPRTTSMWQTVPSAGAGGRLDLVLTATTTIGSDTPINVWHTQAYAPLSAVVTRSTLRAGVGGRVVVEVTDAGEPVAGAKVRLAGGVTGRTGPDGRVALAVGARVAAGSVAVRTTKPGYAPDRDVVRVRARRR